MRALRQTLPTTTACVGSNGPTRRSIRAKARRRLSCVTMLRLPVVCRVVSARYRSVRHWCCMALAVVSKVNIVMVCFSLRQQRIKNRFRGCEECVIVIEWHRCDADVGFTSSERRTRNSVDIDIDIESVSCSNRIRTCASQCSIDADARHQCCRRSRSSHRQSLHIATSSNRCLDDNSCENLMIFGFYVCLKNYIILGIIG